ncbi:uncharacterized protein [Salvelinus alpinus]|uniref:uncharacterized protein n=1 Tax=Salvelinus alpinus TaxID=8036 RepID=UPI0039FBD9ED
MHLWVSLILFFISNYISHVITGAWSKITLNDILSIFNTLDKFLFHTCFPGGCHGNDITPTSDKVFGLEGEVMKLSCNYSSARTFQWYQQYPGSSHTFLLLTGVSSNPSVVNATPPYPRLSVELNERSRVDLDDLLRCFNRLCSQLVLILHILPSTMLLCSLLLFFDLIGLSSEQVLTPYTDVEVASERERVTLSCNYSSGVTPQWYQQYPQSAPQLLVMEHMLANTPGFLLNHDKIAKRVDLEISSVQLTDSALYYCALQPTWYSQYPRSKPEFLILITKSGYVQKPVPPRMSAQVHTDRVDLEISSAEKTLSSKHCSNRNQ